MSEYWLSRAPTRTAAFYTNREVAAVRDYYAAAEAAATPLHSLPGLADALGLAEVRVKDESSRFGLPAFKIVGARYAVARLLQAQPGAHADLACATSGNHGRAVANAARRAGLGAHVYVPAGTVAARISALEREGADVIVSDEGYDETVRRMVGEAAKQGWTVVSDTGWHGYDEIPKWIMDGYSRILEEAEASWGPAPPDVIVVQAGVGSLAGAVAGWLAWRYADDRPALVVVEPVGSGCVRASLEAGRRVTLETCGATDMAGLRCAEVSTVAWPILRDVVDAAVGVTEDDVNDALSCLARPHASDPVIDSAASGAASLAGLLALMRKPSLKRVRDALRLGGHTRALVFNTEGRTTEVPPG